VKKTVSKTKTTCFLVVEPKKIPKSDLTTVEKILRTLTAALLTENNNFQLFLVKKPIDTVFSRLVSELPGSVEITIIYQMNVLSPGAWTTDIVWKHKYAEHSSYA